MEIAIIRYYSRILVDGDLTHTRFHEIDCKRPHFLAIYTENSSSTLITGILGGIFIIFLTSTIKHAEYVVCGLLAV